MKLTNEAIEKILSEAPEGSTHIDEDFRFWKFGESGGHSTIELYSYSVVSHKICGSFIEMNACYSQMYSLDNLQEILQLRKESEQLRQQLEQILREEDEGVEE